MSVEVKVPQLPESVAGATLISWHKGPGDAVNRDESLVELETDKVVLELPAPVTGVIREIKVKNGATHLENLFIWTDQGFLGIVGSMLSGVSMANYHVLQKT